MVYQGLEEARHGHERFEFALFLAVAAHLILILGLSFDSHNGASYTSQLEVTLASHAPSKAPDTTQLLSAADQTGSGDEADHNTITSREVSSNNQVQPEQRASQAAPLPEQQDYAAPATATAAASQTYITKREEANRQLRQPSPGSSTEVDRLAAELANLEARLDAQAQAYSTMPRVRRLTSVSAKRAVDAAYLLKWRQRVEAVGNTYYPEASERYGIYGNLRLLVIIKWDGSLEDIKILSSSGHAVLDEAAIKIVRMAAPFAPFPDELRATTDKLEIIRTWQFRENGLSSG